jgi:hypothetical protein
MIFISFIVLYPILKVIILQDSIFGGDIAQYLITSEAIVYGRKSIYIYPYPLLPILYVPIVITIKDPYVQYKMGCLLGGILFLFFICSVYTTIHEVIRNKRFAPLVSTLGILPLVSYPLYYDEIGWAGQAQFLGLALGMLCVRSYLKRRRITTILLFITTLLAEPWIAIFILISVTVDFMLLHRNAFKYEKLKHFILSHKYFVLLSIIGILTAIMILYFYVYVIANKFPIREFLSYDFLFITKLLTIQINTQLYYQRLVYGNGILFLIVYWILPIMLYMCILIIVKLFKTREQHDNLYKNLVVSFAMASILVILFSPYQYADRGLYFPPISYAFIWSEICSKLFNIKRYWRLNMRKAEKFLVTLPIVTLIVISGSSIFEGLMLKYQDALSYYSIDSTITELNKYINSSSGRILFVSPKAYWFPASFFLKTDAIFTTQPIWFIQNNQIELVKLANVLALSNVIARSANLWVLDAEPLWAQPAPAIYLDEYPYFVEIFRLSDGLLPIYWSPLKSNVTWSNSPFYADKITSSWYLKEDYAEIVTNYFWNTLVVTKFTRVYKNNTVITTLSYNFSNSEPKQIENQLIFLSTRTISKDLFINYTNKNAFGTINITQVLSILYALKTIHSTISVQTSNTLIRSIYVASKEGYTVLIIDYTPKFENTTKDFTITISYRIVVNARGAEDITNSLTLTTREALFRAYNISYVIIDKIVHPDVLSIIERDPNFQKVGELDNYIIYKIKT